MASASTVFEFVDNTDGFKGADFYEVHKNEAWLQDKVKVSRVLVMGKQLKDAVNKAMARGQEHITVKGFKTARNGKDILVFHGEAQNLNKNAYTVSRLQGMAAAYVVTSNDTIGSYESAMAVNAVGFKKPSARQEEFLCYMATVPGAHLFPDVFGFWPLAVALYQYKKGSGGSEELKFIRSKARAMNSQGQRAIDLIKEEGVSMLVQDTVRSLSEGRESNADLQNLADILFYNE